MNLLDLFVRIISINDGLPFSQVDVLTKFLSALASIHSTKALFLLNMFTLKSPNNTILKSICDNSDIILSTHVAIVLILTFGCLYTLINTHFSLFILTSTARISIRPSLLLIEKFSMSDLRYWGKSCRTCVTNQGGGGGQRSGSHKQ